MTFNPKRILQKQLRELLLQDGEKIVKMVPQKRTYQAGLGNRLNSDWIVSGTSVDYDQRSALRTIRQRSRDLVENNEYAAKLILALQNNIVGAEGFDLEVKGRNPDGKLDVIGNTLVENAWDKWTKRGNCEITESMSFRKLQSVAIAMLVREGECFIMKKRGKQYKNGFALQMLEPELVDDQLNRVEPLNVIRAGIEIDKDGKHVAYWVKQIVPTMDVTGEIMFAQTGHYTRVPASDMIHIFVRVSAQQTRGISWFAPVMPTMNQIAGLKQSGVVAARVGAANMGFFEEAANTNPAESFTGDNTTEDGSLEMNADPGVFKILPRGKKFTKFDPVFPTTAFQPFLETMLRGVAAGLGIDYGLLTGDYTKDSWSSGRLSLEESRETFKNLQMLLVEDFLEPVYSDWLKQSLLTQTIALPDSRFDKFNTPCFTGRRWGYINPTDEAKSDEIAISNGTRSRTQVLKQQGLSFDEVLEELADEKQKADDAGVDISPVRKTETVSTQMSDTEQGKPVDTLNKEA